MPREYITSVKWKVSRNPKDIVQNAKKEGFSGGNAHETTVPKIECKAAAVH